MQTHLLDYMGFVESECDEMSRFVPTRWLCLQQCQRKETKQHKALCIYMPQRWKNDSSKQDHGDQDDDAKILSLCFLHVLMDLRDLMFPQLTSKVV